MRATFEAVLFDMDGVLVDSEEYLAEAAIKMFAERHGIAVKAEDFLPFVGAGEDRYLGGVAQKYGVPFDRDVDKARTYALYSDLVRGRMKELPGAAAFVRECRRRGLKTALATSADRTKMEANFRELGLGPDDFDAVVNGLDVVRKKPFPDIYLEAARLVGADPKRCLVVEDAITGIEAAKAAGCACLALTTSFPEASLRYAGADYVAANLAAADKLSLLR